MGKNDAETMERMRSEVIAFVRSKLALRMSQTELGQRLGGVPQRTISSIAKSKGLSHSTMQKIVQSAYYRAEHGDIELAQDAEENQWARVLEVLRSALDPAEALLMADAIARAPTKEQRRAAIDRLYSGPEKVQASKKAAENPSS